MNVARAAHAPVIMEHAIHAYPNSLFRPYTPTAANTAVTIHRVALTVQIVTSRTRSPGSRAARSHSPTGRYSGAPGPRGRSTAPDHSSPSLFLP